MTSRRKNRHDDSWMYILLLTTLVILLYSLSTYKFVFSGIELSYSLIGLPLVFFLNNYISKKYNYAKSIVGISVSGLSLVLYTVIMNFALGKKMVLISIAGDFCSYVASQFVNLTISNFLNKNTISPIFVVFLNYLFSTVVFYTFYTLINLNSVSSNEYWNGYFMSLGITVVISAIMAFIDKKIKLGQAKN